MVSIARTFKEVVRVEVYLGVVPALIFIVLMLTAFVVHYFSVRSGAADSHDDGFFSYVYRAIAPLMGVTLSNLVLVFGGMNPSYGVAAFIAFSLIMLFLAYWSIKEMVREWKVAADYTNPQSEASVTVKQVQ